jgi:uncharacterized protein (TIGR02145 family)
LKILSTFIIGLLFINRTNAQLNVGIGTSTPQSSAQLDVSSTSKGFLAPRMSSAERIAIVSPAEGLLVYQTNVTAGFYFFKNGAWSRLAETSSASIPSLNMCCQTWMAKNLDVNTYRNGDPIPLVTDAGTWGSLTTGAYCFYNNDSTAYAAVYGKLYNWYAINDPRGLAPDGWHIPTDIEWTTLENCLGGVSVAGGTMKEMFTSHWATPNTGAVNTSGFSGVPGGNRGAAGNFGSFGILGNDGYWWSISPSTGTGAWFRNLNYNTAATGRSGALFRNGFSVRCVKD